MNNSEEKLNKIDVGWPDFKEIANYLLGVIRRDNIKIDILVGNARGGLPLAVFLAHHLHIGTEEFGVVRVRRHTSDTIDSKVISPKLTGEMLPDVRGKNVLVVEDTISTGASSIRVIMELLNKKGAEKVTAVAMFVRETSVLPIRVIYFHKNSNPKSKQWVTFPWEK